MNKKLFFGLILLSFLSVVGCNDQFNIGKNIIPIDDLANVNITDTVKVIMYTDSITRVASQSPTYLMVGNYTDPSFGTTDASFMTQVMQTTYPDWNTFTVLDSICLALPLAEDYYYGSSEIRPELSVYELIDTISDQVYYSNTNPDDYTDYDLLGSGIANKFSSSDSIDSLPVAGLRIKLSDAFGERLINQSDYYFNSLGHFYDIFKGIYVKCLNQPGIFKIRTNINSSTTNFGIIIYYHSSENPEKKLNYVLPITSSAYKFNLFNHDFTGVPFESELTSASAAPSDYVYLQAMAGTRIKLTFPGLKNFDENIVINKAELVLNEAPAIILGDYTPCDVLWLDGYNNLNQVVLLQDFQSNSYLGFERLSGKYTINVTRIIQNYKDDVYLDGGIDLYIDLANSKYDFQRTILTNGINADNPPKLIITYSIIN